MEKIEQILKGWYIEGDEFPVKPFGKYINVIIIRRTQSETVFRTDEGLSIEIVKAGYIDNNEISRVSITKRKIISSERRNGREFLTQNNLKEDTCIINQNMCGKCMDCTVYGFAAGEKNSESSGALKSRVITEEAFSILPYEEITDVRTFNALSELGTMNELTQKKKNETGKKFEMRQSLGETEYVKPEVDFIDIETFKDLRLPEIIYVMGNILRTKRYGAITTRMGKIKNDIVAVVVSDCEIFSTLELTKMVWDKLENKKHILDENIVVPKMIESIEELSEEQFGNLKLIKNEELKVLINEIKKLYTEKTDELVKLFKGVKSIFD
ncbi:type I-D CRISPR-associated protein Cas7/Csc2 [Marinitoga sp. 1155]|uniref:type I-D CRISPR-associated protein Cas7/Csc2 n=1 Tax=Marinitoga sp. 1155 TaxID=1428448 RepID=UPI0006412FAF|nr:type I-D CRISPR-associated protein Cas7/Csc2 [Marinitoga sp. 1155]